MNPPNDALIFLVGPTAAGKSEIAVELARRVGGEILSADSMQVYRGMDIGTAKLSLPERGGVPHHLLDILDVTESWDVAQFRQRAQRAIAEMRARGARPIVVGGSGLYVRALSRGLFDGPGRNAVLRAQLEALETPCLRARLRENDPVSATRVNANDRRRMIRALECFMITGRPISELQTQWKEASSGSPSAFSLQPSALIMLGLERPRAEIYARCDRRVDCMLARGLIGEARALRQRGLTRASTAGRAIGYAEVMCYLDGEISLETMTRKIKQRTRQFAKRQWTWFRREPDIRWLTLAGEETARAAAERVAALLRSEVAP